MYSVRLFIILISTALVACGGVTDNLRPSGADKRETIQSGVPGSGVGQFAPDFTVSDSFENSVTLSNELMSVSGAVLYFTMWCPVCNSHTDHMLSNVVSKFPNVTFFLVDYVSGSAQQSRSAQVSNGYGTSPVTVLADIDNSILNAYDATMGSVVVMDSSGVISVNEDYRDGSALDAALAALP